MKLSRFEIGIAGAGIGGLALATLTARLGGSVVVYDQMEKPKPVGSGFVIQPNGASILAAMELLDPVVKRGSRIDSMVGCLPNGRRVLDVSYGNNRFGLAVQRAVLFDQLYAAALNAGVRFEPASRIVAIDSGARPRFRMDNGAVAPPADLVVDAMGANSPIGARPGSELRYGALWANVPWPKTGPFKENLLEQRYDRARRMAGILPVGTAREGASPMAAFFWSLRNDDYDKWRDAGRSRWLDEVSTLWPDVAPLAEVAEPTHARYRHQTRSPVIGTHALRIGDAWHATSPQLGQGANMALMDAASLASAFCRGSSLDEAIRLHLLQRRPHVSIYQVLSRILTPFYQSDSRTLPMIRDHVIAPISGIPIVRRMISNIVTGDVLDPVGRIGPLPSQPGTDTSPSR